MNRTRMTSRESLAVLDVQAHWPGWMPRLAFSPQSSGLAGDLLVVVFLRGAADTLNMVVPHGEDAYYSLRPSLGVPRPDDFRVSKGKRALDLDGFFGLHPAMESLAAGLAGRRTGDRPCLRRAG